jgi:hypothetical protein
MTASKLDGMTRDECASGESREARDMTWAALLARWVEFAKGAVALPRNHEGERLRQSVPDVIMLQAVWFALRNLGELPTRERALGLDRAELLIQKHESALRRRYVNDMPVQLTALLDDALTELTRRRTERV